MKCFAIVAAFLVVLAVVEANQYAEIIKAMAGTCKLKEGASDDDVEKLSTGVPPETKEGKCLAACLGEQFGILKDNKISKEGVKSKLGIFIKDAQKMQLLEELVDACAEVTNEDRCEAAHDIWQCISKEGKARGLKLL